MAFKTDKFQDKLQEQAATTAFQLAWGSLEKLGRTVVDKNAVQRGMQKYAQGFLERHGQLKVLGMHEPVPLRELYTAAQIVPPSFVRSFRTTEDLHEMFVQRGQRHLFLSKPEQKRPALELANKEQFLNVLGAPGAGKSTFLKRLGLDALLPRRSWGDSASTILGLKPGLRDEEFSQYEPECLPVLIELRRFRTDELDLYRLIQLELATCGLPDSSELTRALLDDGRLLLLLDGLDEVPGDKLDAAIVHLKDFIDRHASNRFVTSCRTAFYKDYFPRFTEVLLADFDNEQIASFVRNWFRSEEDRKLGTAEEVLRLLDSPAHEAARELARTPLLLTFLCLSYDEWQQLPPNRSTLYRDALDILLKRWAASKRIHNEPIYRELHADLEVQMLAEIAAPAFRDNRYFFTRRELTEDISRFLKDELHAPKHLDSNQVPRSFQQFFSMRFTYHPSCIRRISTAFTQSTPIQTLAS